MPSALVAPFKLEGENVRSSVAAASHAIESGVLQAAYYVCDPPEDEVAKSIIRSYPNITLLDNTCGFRGKGHALDTGIKRAKADGLDRLVLADADMIGLNPENIGQLLIPLDESIMTLGYIGIRRHFAKLPKPFNYFGVLSGLRAIRTEAWDTLSDGNNFGKHDKRGFNEAVLHGRVAKLGEPIARVAIDGVGHVSKFKKHGNPVTALEAYGSTYFHALRAALWIALEPSDKDLRIEGEVTKSDQLLRAIGAHRKLRAAGAVIGVGGLAMLAEIMIDPSQLNQIVGSIGLATTMTGYSTAYISNFKIETYSAFID
jgi:hypothetical protein